MEGFPPAADKTIRFSDADYFGFPKLRWTVWIDPAADMVIARFASNPVAANAASDPTSLPAYRAIADHLMATDKTPLLGAEWIIEDIAGGGVIDNSHATLHFLADGRLVGSASCNRFFGSYKSTGTQLSIEPAGTTMMACPEALMDQERRLLTLLPAVKSYRIDETGALVLTTTDGKTILARR
jgi:heat shock protein HslJ